MTTKQSLALLGMFLVLLNAPPAKQTGGPVAGNDVYDGFETPSLSELWNTDRFTPGAVEIQSEVVRAGHGAAKITLHPHDTFEAGANGDKDTERDELSEADSLFSIENAAYEYSFSMFLPKDFPVVPTRLVIAQWKQYCGNPNGLCSNDSPVLAFRYTSGELRITQNIGKTQRVLAAEKAEFRGRWLDFRIQVRFTPTHEGRVKVWLGQNRLADYKGVTANADGTAAGYPSPSNFYFKMGLYRDVMAAPMSIYIDEYRKRQLASLSSN